VISFSLTLICQAQAPDTLWTKTYGGLEWEVGYAVQQTTDSGYIISGLTNTWGAGGNDVYLVKTDKNGDTLWSKTYGWAGNESAKSVFQTSDGGYLLAGKASPPSSGDGDFMLIKINSVGDTVWTRRVGGIDNEDCNAVIQTTDGYTISVGSTRSYGPGSSSVYLVETSPAADTIWEDWFGSTANDEAYAVQETNNGYIISAKTASFGAGSYDAWFIRIDWDYNIIWDKTIGGVQSDHGFSVQQTSDWGFIGAGSTESFGPGDYSFFLMKLTANGDSSWARTYGGVNRDECFSVAQTSDDGYIMAGSTKSFGSGNYDWLIIRTNSNGDSLWSIVFGGTADDECHSIQPTYDGGYIVAGSTRSYGAGNSDFWLIKLAPDPTNINELNEKPDFELFQNYPNPVNQTTRIRFILHKPAYTELKLYDMLGNEIESLVDMRLSSGNPEVTLNTKDFPVGVYYYTLFAGNSFQSKKMIIW